MLKTPSEIILKLESTIAKFGCYSSFLRRRPWCLQHCYLHIFRFSMSVKN
ncbi:hypothetical protein VCHA50P415_20112 [Vibrio chagasii]|nr:hypothetical protein VCHA27O13_130068 [Vibrio chagasii]CAH6797575.1 hypothetical protein VCHA35O142_100069 [Vibrio chagasii]CAH6800128.1 hypothetical protein VCHA36P164_100142 [Vibrio chagasii]CAH6846939.1 hypothetical protein VCHA35O143_10343 [Vibrio chagasii]CAH6848675.1 hypothetical protein VCHA31O73_10550 [Vibrio chagasii]